MNVLPFFDYSLYEMFHIFCIWSFIGWCVEVCYMTIETGEYQNRGFLSMPICPIYGFGVLMVVVFFRPIENDFFLLFLSTGALCTLFELMVGLGMEKMFHTRWWDYSHERFNFKGYICLKVSILWGLGCATVVRFVHPLVEKYVGILPQTVGLVIIVIMSVLIVIDLISSISAVNHMNNRLKQIDEISNLMLKGSVKIGENLATETNEIMEKYDKLKESKPVTELKEKYEELKESKPVTELKEKYEELKESIPVIDFKETKAYQELKEKYESLINIRDRQIERLIKAYPTIRSVSYKDSMEKLKEMYYVSRVKNRRRKRKRLREKRERAAQKAAK
ncbi:MAG: hypothetical protein IJF18_03095 [Oscillospiraceae bacterium]|nr:hypothetical protein [Oscillospiraceae bacterium]